MTDGSTFASPAVSADGGAAADLAAAMAQSLLGAPMLVGLFRLPGLETVVLNATARKRLCPADETDPTAHTLCDFIGVSCLEKFQAEIVPRACAAGRWSGHCELRDCWGSEFDAFTALAKSSRRGQSFLLLLACEGGARSGQPALNDSDLLRALLDNVPEAIYFKDRNGRFLRVSRAHARLFGLRDPREAIGRTDFDFFTADHAGPAFETEQMIIRTGDPLIGVEEKETWEDGRITWASTTKLPLRDRDGEIVGTLGVSHDITARKAAEDQHRQMEVKLRLAQRLESIGRLAAGIAHEINTPSQFIADNTRFLGEAFEHLARQLEAHRAFAAAVGPHPAAPPPDRETDYFLREVPVTLEQTLEGLTRIARIVRSLKEFSHPKNASRAPADLNQAIETALTVSRHEWKYVADVATELDPALPPVPCVADEINQALLNLIVNAAHAIEATIKAGGPPRGTIAIRTRRAGEHACVEVEDTGQGIPPEIRDRIFEPFFTTKEIGKGTGQGLAVVRTVVEERHRGRVEFDSRVGKGTVFRLFLPLVAPAEAVPHDGEAGRA